MQNTNERRENVRKRRLAFLETRLAEIRETLNHIGETDARGCALRTELVERLTERDFLESGCTGTVDVNGLFGDFSSDMYMRD